MTESTGTPSQEAVGSETGKLNAAAYIKDLESRVKQLESQLVSSNFVVKNTQNEVIKLQKTLAKQQTHQDEIEKKLTKTEHDLKASLAKQHADETFRSRIWFYQVATGVVTLLVFLIFSSFAPKPSNNEFSAPAPIPSSDMADETGMSSTSNTSDSN